MSTHGVLCEREACGILLPEMRAGGYVEADDTRLHLVGTRIRGNVRELVGRGREVDRLPLHPVK